MRSFMQIVEHLLEKGADVNAKDVDGSTVKILSVYETNEIDRPKPSILSLLFFQVLHFATLNSNDEMVNVLIEAGAQADKTISLRLHLSLTRTRAVSVALIKTTVTLIASQI